MTEIFQVLGSCCRLRSLELACSEKCSLRQDLIDFKTRTTGPYDRISIRKPFFYRVSPNFSLWNQRKPLKYVCFNTSRSPVGILTQDHPRSLETKKYTDVVPWFLIQVFKWLIRDIKYINTTYPRLMSIVTNNRS